MGQRSRRCALAVWTWLALLCLPALAQTDTNAAPLVSIRQVRELTSALARKSQPVRLEGVLTYVDLPRYMCFLQDDSGGIYLQINQAAPIRAGQRLRVLGVTAAGNFAPIVRVTNFTVLDAESRSQPAARRVSFPEFKTGLVDAERVELQGRVRSARLEQGWLKVKLALPEGVLTVWVRDYAGLDPSRLVAAEIRAQGICAGAFGGQNEILDFDLYVNDATGLQVLDPAPMSSGTIPVRPINRLGLDWRDGALQARCRGRVTLHWPGRFLFIEDGTGAVEVRTEQRLDLQPGDEVEALGFRMLAHRRVVLEDCVVTLQGHGAPPVPQHPSLREIYARHSHGELVVMEGTLAELVSQPRIRIPSSRGMSFASEPVLVMKVEEWFLRAELPPGSNVDELAFLKPGSRLALTGVVAADAVASGEPLTYRLLLPSKNAIRMLQPASWWTVGRLVTVVGGVAAALIAFMGWVVGFTQRRRRQAEQAVQRHHEQTIRHQAVLLELACRVQGSDDQAVLKHAVRQVATTLAVSRVSLWRFEEEGRTLRCMERCDHQRDGGSGGGTVLATADFPAYFAALAESRVLAAVDVNTDPRTRELAEAYLGTNDIRSMLDVPLRLRGRPAGVLCLEQTGVRREWTSAEESFAAGVADQLTILLESRERKRTEQALRESEAKFARAFHTSADAHAIITLDGERYLEVNDAFCRLAGRSREQVLSRDVTQFTWVTPGVRAKLVERVRSGEQVRDFETQIIRPDGDMREVLISCDLADLSGEPCLLGVVRDVTERRRSERALKEAHAELELRVLLRTTQLAEARDRAESADRLKSAFLATMSHELRTPLNSIIGFTGIILQGLVGPLTDEQKKQLGMVMNSSRHLLSLINDVLDISKIEAGQIEVHRAAFDFRESVHRVAQIVAPLAARKGLPVRVTLAPEVGRIVSDRRRVEQILINLVNNAIKFTDRGEVHVEGAVQGGELTVRVSDTGIGIRAEDMGRLFRPFQQLDVGLARQHEGTGLGLAICSRLVKILGGEITVESTVHKGSTFTLTLPLQDPNRR
ncbi:MAG TPA: ATP-binding protein [Candidatus Limnocylindria bacterium]|jgi:PAS domain S-box-containing protein|nr:ATP-binding protein [Candidatus Limnocylindria bacterium]